MPEEISTEETSVESTTEEETPQVEGQEADDQTLEGADALGDAGKKALDSMKDRWKGERDKRRASDQRIADLEAQIAKLSGKDGDDKTPDADAIRAEADRAATTKANARVIRSEIKAAAAGKLADPADALAYLDASTFEVDENGDVDAEEIGDAITDLLTRKPYLAAKATRFQGSGDGGAARKASGPSQLTQEDLKTMTPQAIVKAKAEGRLKKLLGG